MQHLALHGDRAANIGPTAELTDGEVVTGLEDNIGIEFARRSPANGNFAMLQLDPLAIHNGIAGKIRRGHIGAAFESTRHAQQGGGCHIFRERIFTRTQNFAINRDLGSIRLIAPVNAYGIEWLQSWPRLLPDRKSTRLNSSHANISYAVFC